MKRPVVLIADDDQVFCELMHSVISAAGYEVHTANGLDACINCLQQRRVDILFQDLCFPALSDGYEALDYAHEKHPETTVIMISGEGHIPDAVRALKCGAVDFIEKPIHPEHILAKIMAKESQIDLEESNKSLAIKAIGMVGTSQPMQIVYENIIRAARFDTPVLITGETGVGKELVARAIHKLSKVADKNLITVNCGAIPDDLIEAELFGYEQGAFTHAVKARKGFFEYADGSSIFLNEIGELPFHVQAKLLRVLSEGEVQKIGGERLNIKTRVICDTNRDLQQAIQDNLFREDLFYRISTMRIHVPPLRERIEDIPALANYFLDSFSAANNLPQKPITPQAMQWLSEQTWNGNVRELKNTIERGVINAKNDHITVVDLHPDNERARKRQAVINSSSFRHARQEFEKEFIISALARHNGNITQTAKAIEYDKSNLIKKMKKYGIRA